VIQQIPTPPPIGDPNLIFMSPDGPKIVLMIVLAALTASVVILWPIMRAIGRRMEHKAGPDPLLKAEIEQLHQRLAEMEPLQTRVAELEERLDFAERLLAQGKEQERLPR
jgi:Tfp pilus assembly protein PilO